MPVLIKRQYIFVSVEDAEYTNLGRFKLSLPQMETGDNIINRMYIKKAIIPYNWRRVTTTNKTLTINGVNYSLTEGNPNIIDLIQDINNIQTTLTATFNRITSKIEWFNNTASAVTFSTTAYEMLGAVKGATYTMPALQTYVLPRIVDVRPTPIIEVRVDVATAGYEISNGGDISNTNILCAISMNVPVYSHKVWIDDNALYFADVTNENRDLTLTITDTHGMIIEPQSSPYFVIGIDTLANYQSEQSELQRELVKLQKYNLILSHGTDATNK